MNAPTRRTAHCCCGALRLDATGEPVSVVVCHCSACQRRTGAAFGTGVYFEKARIATAGPAKTFIRKGESGSDFTQYFCPDCGTTLFWETQHRPGLVGVALGGFGGPAFGAGPFPDPTRSVWEENKHGWVTLGGAIPGHSRGSNSAKTR